jgi:hypothetical protein
MARTRPTLRCLREDLALSPGTLNEPLDELDHPLLTKANEQFANSATRHERIAAIDDHILFKVKIQRWRGAVWTDGGRVALAGRGRAACRGLHHGFLRVAGG